jgi:ABC-type lipoprotein export system ATPase subunit
MTLSAQSLTKRYGAAFGYTAVHGVSLDLRRGEFISIVGRSGSGKSTLMAMLGALTKPTEGRLLLDGTDVWTLSETQRATFRARQIGFVFQFPSLLSNLRTTSPFRRSSAARWRQRMRTRERATCSPASA